MVIGNSFASFTRNLHFWSAQSSLVFSILHIYDHLKKSNESKISSKAVWFRLTLSIAFLGYIMISGFILKADADSLQARRILSSLLLEIPFIGSMLDTTFIGPENNWQILYVQHIATGTIILLIAIYDHVKTIWVNSKTFVVVLIALILLSLVFRAPLTSISDPLMKGPWYFVGLQELLHWISRPGMIMILFFAILLLIYTLPRLKKTYLKAAKICLISTLVFYLLLTIIAYFFRGENWRWQWPWAEASRFKTAFYWDPIESKVNPGINKIPSVLGQPEGCLSCHDGMKGLSNSHSGSITGCYACHLGDPFTLNKKQAHRNMELIPGNLSNAARTCGNAGCHPGITDRVNKSMMSTLTGMISVDRFVFGESAVLDGPGSIHDLKNTAADTHLKNLCVGCHLGSDKTRTGPASFLERGGGCNACHLTYSPEALKDLESSRINPDSDSVRIRNHPNINLAVTNDKCLSCHSRSGRISMNYEGWHETNLKNIPKGKDTMYRALPDSRIFITRQADVHHRMGMTCIDCHHSFEVMGDGEFHAHKEQAVSIQCIDCHPKNKTDHTIDITETNRETQLIAWLRNFNTPGTHVIATHNGNYPLVNTFIDLNGQVNLISKLSGKTNKAKFQDKACYEGSAHQRLSCNACHSSWVPQCIGCHNSYENQTTGFDMLNGKKTKGSWVEYADKSFADPPVLGINEKSGKLGKIQTFVPGMILTIDKGSFKKGNETLFHRLYAPVSAHTTQKEVRTCKSCHNDPLALGFGRGSLEFSPDRKWIFIPRFAPNKNDGLPEDAWTGFLSERTGVLATRNGLRPFSVKEQKRILTVGTCLTCHDASSQIMKKSLQNFQLLLSKRSQKCIVPKWD
jgi:hypothetical protein